MELYSKFYDKVTKQLSQKSFYSNRANSVAVDNYVRILRNIKERMTRLNARLNEQSGAAFYKTIKNNYFKEIDKHTDEMTDPKGLLNKENYNFIYVYLASHLFNGKKSPDALRALTAQEIRDEILKLINVNKEKPNKQSFVKLLRELRTFFSDELVKEEYDAFIDGSKALSRLVISDKTNREKLLQRWGDLEMKRDEVQGLLLEAQQYFKK